MEINLKQELKNWEEERENHNEYELQLKYFKTIKKNVPQIVDFWKNLSSEKKELLRKKPIVYYVYKAWEEGFIKDINTFVELNEEFYIRNKENGKDYSIPYFEISKELLKTYNINEDTFNEWKNNIYGLNEFFEANKKYYSKLIENEGLNDILDLIEESLNVNSTKSSQGCNKTAINKGNGLFNIFEMFVFIYDNELHNFENLIKKVPKLDRIAKEVFGFYNLDKDGFIFNSKIVDFMEKLYEEKKIVNPSDIKKEFQELEKEYVSLFQNQLFVDKITENLIDINLSEEQIKNIQTHIQIDQFIYTWNKKNKEKILSHPFSEIFEDREQAESFFNYAKEKLQILGIQSKESKKFTVTIPKKGNRNLVRIIYGPWVILDFEKINENRFYRIALKIKDELSKFKKSDDSFKIYINDKEYSLYEVPIENIKDIDHLIDENFAEIGNKFLNYTKTPYANKGYQELKDAIFDEKSRNKIFKKIFKLIETKDIDEPLDFKESTEKNSSSDTNHFWVTANPKIWKVNKLEKEGSVFYTSTNNKGNKRRIYSVFEEAKENDKVIFYESTPVKKIVAEGRIIKGLHKGFDNESQQEKEGIKIIFERKLEPISWKTLIEVEELKNSAPILNGAQGSLFKLTKEEYETILALEELDEIIEEKKSDIIWSSIKKNLEYEKIREKPFEFNNELHLEKGEKEKIERMITQAIKQGKHIILIGPPGTGKSKLAKQICEKYVGNENYFMTTAISDWSTFDTIGGLHPKDEGLEFKQGLILNCFKEKITKENINKWLIIDEINRADIDKAFGSLFSALTGDTIELAYEIHDKQIKVIGKPKDKDELNENDYFIHSDWRIIATMNSLDKASLYEMSYAFMRRFAFIPVNIPSIINEDLIKNYCKCWKIELDDYKTISKLWNVLSTNNIQIGPSIIEDICKYISKEVRIEEAITLFVLPQLEGKTEKEIEDLFQGLKKININTESLKKDFSTFLGFKLKNEQNTSNTQ